MKSNAQFADECADDIAARATSLGIELNDIERQAISTAIYGALNRSVVRGGRKTLDELESELNRPIP